MPDEPEALVGRAALPFPDALRPDQRRVSDIVAETMVPWAQRAGFEARLPDGRLIGPFNTILLGPGMAEAFLPLQAAEKDHTILPERVRQVVILTVGAAWRSDCERYAHAAAAREAGFLAAAVEALRNGRASDALDREEQVAQRFTVALAIGRQVDDALFAEAGNASGDRGIVDLIVPAGCYGLISSLLNAFRVPVPG